MSSRQSPRTSIRTGWLALWGISFALVILVTRTVGAAASTKGEPVGPAPSSTSVPIPTPPSRMVQTTWPQDLSQTPPLPEPPARRNRRHTFLNPGYLLSISPGIASRSYTSGNRTVTTDVATGHGIELSLATYAPRSLTFFGGFAQLQQFFSFNGDHTRYALGVQGGWLFVVGELGLAHRTEDNLRSSTTMMHLGIMFSIAFFHVGGQMAIPVTHGAGPKPAYSLEGSLVMAVKIPVILQ